MLSKVISHSDIVIKLLNLNDGHESLHNYIFYLGDQYDEIPIINQEAPRPSLITVASQADDTSKGSLKI